MHGEQLDRVRLADPARLQTELLLLRRREIGEERAQRRLRLIARERRRHVGERVQVGPRGGQVAARPGGDLDIQAQRALHLGDQVGQRPGHVPAQISRLLASALSRS